MIRLNRDNLFDVVRLYAALQVLLNHGVARLGFTIPGALAAFFSFPGVPIFFGMSGFLVTISWINNRSSSAGWKSYVVSRSLRIFPALWAAALFGWLICLFLGKASFALSPLGFAWLLGQSSFATVFNPDQLRDFGIGVMNGSLWTIPIEIEFYILIPFLIAFSGRIFRLNRFLAFAVVGGLILAGFSLQHYLNDAHQFGDGSIASTGAVYLKLLKVSIFPYIGQFLLGASFVGVLVRFGQARCSNLLLLLGVVIGLAVRLLDSESLYSLILYNLSLSSFFIGLGLVNTRLKIPGDISYGLYLYHGPVINIIIILFGKTISTPLVSLYFIATFLLATASWIFLEKPCLNLRKSLITKLAS